MGCSNRIAVLNDRICIADHQAGWPLFHRWLVDCFDVAIGEQYARLAGAHCERPTRFAASFRRDVEQGARFYVLPCPTERTYCAQPHYEVLALVATTKDFG